MIGADAAGHRVVRAAVYGYVPALGVYHPVVRLPVNYYADANARPHSYVHTAGEPLRAAPGRLAEGGGVHVRVYAHGHAELRAEDAHYRVVPPAKLGGCRYAAVGLRIPVQVQKPEAADAEGVDILPAEIFQYLRHTARRLRGGYANLLHYAAVLAPNGAHHFRAACLQRSQISHKMSPRILYLCRFSCPLYRSRRGGAIPKRKLISMNMADSFLLILVFSLLILLFECCDLSK